MVPILTAEQVRSADRHTIENEPILSIDLMERASQAFANRFMELVSKNRRVKIFCGTGNNGGDGLAVARLLSGKGFSVHTYVIGNPNRGSLDFSKNLERLNSQDRFIHIEDEKDFPLIDDRDILIDAIFGSGLSRPVEGLHGLLIQHLNHAAAKIVSVDIASGLFSDQTNAGGDIVRPWVIIAFQTPKLAFFQPQLASYVGNWFVEDIGLDKTFISSLKTRFYFTEASDVKEILKSRGRFTHKGDAGRLLLVSGSKGKMGAAILASRAAMRSGTGLLTVHVPACGSDIVTISVPEAMTSIDQDAETISHVDLTFQPNAIGVGPGLGTTPLAVDMMKKLLQDWDNPLVLDADALNILAKHRELLELIPAQSILTPHPGEFKRLVGEWKDDYEKLTLLQSFCKRHQVNVVLKGAFSAVCDPSGKVCFNPTGNAGMATAGSGDVLTGVVSSLLAQGYEPTDALKLAVYVHGTAGDLAKKKVGEFGLIASDIIEHLPMAFLQLEEYKLL
ncbi:MAG: NAD(P)H-hydrate dehydratase [Cyclobacteriaceae bacterium]